MTKLERCPFCDADDALAQRSGDWWLVICANCGARTARWMTKEVAIECWNKRVGAANAWTPVENHFRHEHENERGSVTSWIEVVLNGELIKTCDNVHIAAARLPENIRLCRLVEAPPVPTIPEEVRATIEEALLYYRSDIVIEAWSVTESAAMGTMCAQFAAAQAWLDSL